VIVNHPVDPLTRLCLTCGLCCDGTLFKDVEIPAGDPALAVLGLAMTGAKLPQPCTALQGDCSCRIYAGRPARCRQFECALYVAVKQGQRDVESALQLVTQTRKLAGRVRRLLRQLGDGDEAMALSLRFQAMQRRQEQGTLEDETAETFAELTLAVNELTRAMEAGFYSRA
jgi:Fe-S-cluster containining protein